MRRAMSLMLVMGLSVACAAEAAEPMFPVTGPLAGSGGRREWREERRGEPREVRSVDRRQGRQERRVGKGAATGQLTKGEQAQLDAQMKRIQELESQLRKQGLSPTERARLQLELNRAARDIARPSNNQQTQPAAPAAPPVPPPPAAPATATAK